MEQIRRIRAAETDGRAQNVRYIQKLLTDLHEVITENASILQEAMRSDSYSYSYPAETEVEFYLAVDCVKKLYEAIDFEHEMKQEYSVAHGIDASERRTAAGTVYIVPANHTRFYSVISPLSAAIAAGNCVIVELPNSLLKLPALLRSLLIRALDHDTVAVLDDKPKASDLPEDCIKVYAQGLESSTPSRTQMLSSPQSRAIAIVDRHADIDLTAERIVRARAGFGGRSPYAPDIVLVNEFKVKDFLDAAVVKFTKHLSAPVATMNGYHKPRGGGGEEPLSKDERSEPGTTVVVTGDHGTIVSVSDRRSKLLRKKYTQPILVIHPVSSLDDAIDFANSSDETLLALYSFGDLPTCKYLSQFISAYSSFANDIPIPLLVGPAAPLDHRTCVHPRYIPEMFTIARPAFATPDAESVKLRKALDNTQGARHLRAETLEKLSKTGQREGKAVGFFDQGLLVGVGMYVMPVVAGLGVLGFYGVKAGMRRLR